MIRGIQLMIRQEWRLLSRDKMVWLVLAIFAGLSVLGTRNGIDHVNARSAAWNASFSEETRKRANFKQVDAGFAGYELAHSVHMPAKSLGILGVGQNALFPDQIQVSTVWSSLRQSRETIENPLLLAVGIIDVSFIVVYLVPLLVIAWLFDLLSSERERGTLPLMLMQSAHLPTLFAVRIGLRLALIMGVLFGVILLVTPGDLLKHFDFLIWSGACLAWAMLWCGLTLLVNSFRLSSPTNAVLLVSVWLFGLVLLPSLTSLTISSVYPVPSRLEMVVASREAESSAERDRKRHLVEFLSQNPKLREKVATSGAASGDFSWPEWILMMQTAERSTAKIRKRYNDQLAHQEQFVDSIHALLPGAFMQVTLDEICGVSRKRHIDFERQAADFNAEWSTYFQNRIFEGKQFGPQDLPSLPRFRYDIARDRRAEMESLGRLTTLFAAVAGLSLWGLRRVSKLQN